MTRARLSVDGIDIAKPGYDVDTAGVENMIFSSRFVAMRLVQTAVVTVAPYSGYMSADYNRAIVNFTTPFAVPPIVLAAGINNDGSSDQSQYYITAISLGDGGSRLMPHYSIETYTNRFELYVLKQSGGVSITTSWRYFLFANTLT